MRLKLHRLSFIALGMQAWCAVSLSLTATVCLAQLIDVAEAFVEDSELAPPDNTPTVQVSDGAVAPDEHDEKGEPAAWASDEPAPARLPASPSRKPAASLGSATIAPAKKRPALDPASLDGVHPSRTTREELHKKWGEPEQVVRVAGGVREIYHVEKLGRVRVAIVDDVVDALAVRIDRPLPLEALAGRLAVDDVESVNVYDEQGDLLGAAYPERGVLLAYVPGMRPPRVFQVVIEAIDAQPFLVRAEARLARRYDDCRADLEQALALSPDHPRALRLQADLALRLGKLDDALKHAQRAADLEPNEPAHRLLLARVLAAAGDIAPAIARLRDLLDEPDLDDLAAAAAHLQWGDYLARSARSDYAAAIEHHQHAIKLAEPLARHRHRSVRRAAKELLLDAHLAVAHDIGWGRWQQKAQVVPQWLERAASHAEALGTGEGAGPEARLKFYSGAVSALAGIAEPPAADAWIAGLRGWGKKLYEASPDPEYRAHLSWQVARALGDAVEIETARGRPDEAIALGQMAHDLFDESKPAAGSLPTYDYERGRLCYRMGAVYALVEENHAQAVVWFDRAAPLLESPVPSAAVDAGTQGEAFVSMAVSYWEQANRDEALRLTSQGLKLMEQAVENGTLAAAELAVPYANLASMHAELGDHDQAQWYAELAARYEEGATK